MAKHDLRRIAQAIMRAHEIMWAALAFKWYNNYCSVKPISDRATLTASKVEKYEICFQPRSVGCCGRQNWAISAILSVVQAWLKCGMIWLVVMLMEGVGIWLINQPCHQTLSHSKTCRCRTLRAKRRKGFFFIVDKILFWMLDGNLRTAIRCRCSRWWLF